MSEYHMSSSAGPSPPDVPTEFTTQNGVAVPVANNLNVFGQDGITTFATTGTVTITPRGVGSGNMFLGQGAGNLTVTGNENVAYGAGALASITTGQTNTAIGVNALTLDTDGRANTAVGIGALQSNVHGIQNTAVGEGALANSLSNSNTAIGSEALDAIVLGTLSVAVGAAAGSSLVNASFSTAVGASALELATGQANCCVGYQALQDLTTGTFNSALGTNAAPLLLTGSLNTFIGNNAGISYTGAESNNVIIANTGVVGESSIIRIGTQGTGAQQQNTCFIAGIVGVTVSNAQQVVINSATGQLGVGAGSGLVENYTATAISYNVKTTDVIIGVTSTAAPRTMTMPNAGLTTGQQWTIKDESGGAATNNITVSGNGANIDGASTFVMNSNYQAINIYYNGTNFFIV